MVSYYVPTSFFFLIWPDSIFLPWTRVAQAFLLLGFVVLVPYPLILRGSSPQRILVTEASFFRLSPLPLPEQLQDLSYL